MKVRLILHPGGEANRSMALYGERLVRHAPTGADWALERLPLAPGPAPWNRRLAQLLLAPGALRRLNADVAHVLDHAHAVYLQHLRVPTVVTVHDLMPWKALTGQYPAAAGARVSRRAAWWFRRSLRALPRAAAVVTPSTATARALQPLLGERAVHVVPHGVDPVFANPPAPGQAAGLRRRLGIPPEARTLIQVSSAWFYKNDAGFAAAFDRLATTQPQLWWLRIGKPPAPELARRIAAAPWRGRVVFAGGLDATDLAALYADAGALLFPSWDEGFGWPPLEAMAAGCPVVATQRGALAETCAAGASIIEPDDPAAMAAAVAALLDDPEHRAAQIAAGRRHAAGYRWQDATAAMARIYAAVAS